jgi:hypothetical protein
MILYIKLQENFNLDPFINEWLIPALKSNLKSNLFSNKRLIFYYYGEDFYQDLFLAVDSIELSHINLSNSLTISINQNKKNIGNTAKLYDICTMIDFGSLSNPAIPIFTKTFNYFAKNFWKFYRDYNLGILRKCL